MSNEYDLVRGVADDLPVGVWVARANGDYLYSNRTFVEIMGQGPVAEASLGGYTQVYGIFKPDGAPYPEEQLPIVRALQEREVVVVDDLVIHRGDGRRIPVRAHARPVFDASRTITHVVIVFFDITREAQARRASAELEDRLRHGERMQSIGQLAAGIAHDFNNVLAVIRLLGGRLAGDEKHPNNAEMKQQLDDAVQTGTRLAQQLLVMGGRARTTTATVELTPLIASVAQLLSRTLDRRIVVTHETDGSAMVIDGDPSRLEQVVMNLVINARDALDGTGGKVAIRLRSQQLDDAGAAKLPPLRAGRHVVLEVEDDGPGVPPHLRRRIFEPYFTTRATGEQRGTGLGLATVYGIVEAHRGAIEVRDAVPHGALMRVWLPASESVAVIAPPALDELKGLVPGEGTVLVVDDEAALRQAVAGSLTSLGYEVLLASDGLEAIEILSQRRGTIGVMLLDLMMPRLDGPATFAAARKLDPGLPVIFATGTPDDPATVSLASAGIAQVLAKPYSLPRLSSAIARARRRSS